MGILSDGYVMGDRIGKGGFGTVYKAIKKLTDRTVAVKKLERDKFPDRIEEEIRALERMRHRNIVQYYESFDEGGYKYIVMEYCEHGDLRSYLRRNGPLSDKEAAHVLSQLIDAVSYIHRQMLMHRDLSTGNVLISHITRGVDDDEVKLEVKLTDFGLATVMRPGTKGAAASVVGTPGFVAPQVYLENYSKEADVYSLGALLYSMTTGKSPPDIRPSRREPQAELDLRSLSPEAADLIERMMCKDHKRRIQLNG
uniref:Protein kinase domain-containing protein n=1 Tax=Plectus sambesii TaxID=2011161 RepID=A0A914UW33_9BILA